MIRVSASPPPGSHQETSQGPPRQQRRLPEAVTPALPCPNRLCSSSAQPGPDPPDSSSTGGVRPSLLILLLPLVSRCFQNLRPKWWSTSKDMDTEEVRSGAGASSAASSARSLPRAGFSPLQSLPFPRTVRARSRRNPSGCSTCTSPSMPGRRQTWTSSTMGSSQERRIFSVSAA